MIKNKYLSKKSTEIGTLLEISVEAFLVRIIYCTYNRVVSSVSIIPNWIIKARFIVVKVLG